MKYYLSLFLFFSLSVFSQTSSTDQVFSELLDSASLYQNKPEEVAFLKQGLEYALRHNNTRSEVLMLTHLTRNAYNRWLPDSISYWGEKGVVLAQQQAHYSMMFDMLSLLCLREMFLDDYEKASDLADKLYKLGKELNDPAGIIASYEAMGILYRQTSRPKQALSSYVDGLVFLRQSVNRPNQELQFISYIIEILLTQGKTDEALLYIDDYDRILASFSDERIQETGMIPISRCKMLLACYRTDYYIRLHQYDKAKASYLESASYRDQVSDVYVQYYFDLNTIAYHQYITREYGVALEDINKVILVEKAPEMVQRKADIQLDMGHYKEAVLSLKEVIHLKDSISDYELNSQLNSLRSKLDLNKLELEKKELEAKRNELHMRIFMLCLIFSVAILLILAYILVRTFRVKNILKKSERDLKVAKEKAEESNRLKTVFIQNMSHEIRTPLNAIVGFSSLLAEMPEEAPQFCGLIEENSNMLLKLVDDLLNISVIESRNHTTLNPEDCDLNECCQKALESIKSWVKPEVRLTFSPDHTHSRIYTDPLRLHQVITNLLTNASKYTTEGEINLSCLYDRNLKQIRLMVTDTGIGIPADKQEAVFERFVKLDNFKQGTGLGLYICRTIVQAMKGRIFVDGTYMNGARFIVDLPHKLKEF